MAIDVNFRKTDVSVSKLTISKDINFIAHFQHTLVCIPEAWHFFSGVKLYPSAEASMVYG
jgi:hypothetical protein